MARFTTFSIGSPYTVVSTVDSGSTVSTTGITLLNSVLITGNTFNANDVVTIEGLVTKSNSLGTLTLYFYWNTSASLSGAILLGTSATVVAATRYYLIYRKLNIVNATNSTVLAPTATVGNQDNAILSGALSTVAINWTSNGYIILAADHSSASENVVGQWIKVSNF